jgi:hypothetical protein
VARIVLAGLIVAALAGMGIATAGAHRAQAAGSCHLSSSEQRHMGASYVTSLNVTHTGCTTGKKVVRDFNSCRHRHGGARGHCGGVDGYKCSERRSGIKVQYDSDTNCWRSSRHVRFTYVQNT